MKIDIATIDGLDRAVDGWRFSRHDGAATDFRDVYAVDVPVNELPSAVLHVRDATILEREVFASMRNHVIWARTSHVDDPAAFVVPPDLATPMTEVHRGTMLRERDAGRSQDEWRRHLPVTSTTAFATRISFRDLVKLSDYFAYLADQPIAPAVRQLFALAAAAVDDVVTAFVGDVPPPTYQPIRLLHEGRVASRPAGSVVDVGEFVVATLDVPVWMRAQIVRHRPLSIVDTFYRDVVASPDVLDLTIDESVTVEVAAPRAYWRTILSKRTCWLAQDSLATRRDPWQEIIDRFGFRVDMLPCADGRCPYAGDAGLRVRGEDPGVPCPRHCDIVGVDKAPFRERMVVAARSRHPHWLEEIAR